MRKTLFSNSKYLFLLSFSILIFFSDLGDVKAQCGFSAFNEGGTLTPINNTWSSVSVGSGTYVNFNVTAGRIYSFGYLSNSALLPYVWDMTLTQGAGIISYNNSLTPVRDPYTGGTCPVTPRPSSAEYYSPTFSGVIAVNTHSWNAGCFDYIPAQGSALLSYKECIPSADPGSGNNLWNVDAFPTTNINIPVPAARYGYYTDNNVSFNTQTSWSNLSNPSSAGSWSGCSMPNDHFTIRARRTGFPCNRYIVSLVDAQDAFRIYINGVLTSSSTTPGQLADMILGPSDSIEIRMVATCAADLVNVSIAPQGGIPPIVPGTIAGVSNVCEGTPVGNLNSTAPGSGGVSGLTNGGVITYTWEYSINGGPYFVIPGATGASYNSTATIPPGDVFRIRRRATDRCGTSDVSNVIAVVGRANPNAGMSPSNQTVCPGIIPFVTLNFNPGTGPFNIAFTDGVNPYTRTGKNNGDTLQLGPGSYTFTSITDSFGCVRTTGFTSGAQIVVAAGITFSMTKVDASCASVFDGSITVNVSGGAPPLSYSLNGGPTQPGNVFSGLYAGTYTVTVYDTYGCSNSDTITINNTYIISVAVDSSSNISCYGGGDGSLTVHVVGGVPPYSYSLNGITFQSSGTFTGLVAANYIVVGRDSKGCTETVNVNIAQPGQLTITIDSITNVVCNGDSTGAIYITANGGTAPFTYLWNDGTTTEDNSGLQAGVRNVTVTDSKGCTASAGATVTEPLQLFVNVALYNDLLCYGDSSGAIDITANGGVPPYQYTWSNGTLTEDLANLPIGCYSVTVVDANGCSQTLTQCLSEPAPIVSSVIGTDVVCFGGSSGTADLTVSGGSAPYFYQWSTFEATQDLTGLSGGLYYVIITDNNGCQKRDSVLINEPANPLTLSLADTNITCFNSNDGSIDLTVTGGTPAYTYLWSNNETTEDLDSLPGGTYAVTVTDANGCTASASAIIINPLAIATNYVVTNPLCFGDTNGAINLITSGGTPGYSFIWSSGEVTEDVVNKPAGVYSVTITDSRNCIKIDSAKITDPPAFYVSGVIKHVSCFGYKDGAIDITAYGGTLPYNFNWAPNGESTEDLWNLSGGSDTVFVTDNNGCLAVSIYVVNEPQPLVVDVTGTNVLCAGTNTGSLVVLPSGGTTPYEYLWNDFYTDSVRSSVAAGRYVVLVTDSNGCHTYDSLDITEPAPITITGVVTDVLCNGFSTGAIDVTVTGGAGAYSFVWSNSETTEDINGLASGTYSVTVTDASNCTETATFTVNETISLYTNVSTSNPSCSGGNTGFISVVVTGGSIPYTYSWSNVPPSQGATATNLGAGSYTLTVSDLNSCSATISATLFDPAPIIVTPMPTPAVCYNTATGYVTASVTGGTPPYIYQLNGIIQPSDTFFNLLPGNYVLAVRDANGCEGTATFTITSPPQVTVDLIAVQDVIYQGMTTQLVATATPQTPSIVNYTWTPLLDSSGMSIFDFSDCIDPNNCNNPYVSPVFTTLFTVSATNDSGCVGYDTVTVTVEVQPSLFIPTAFTPNGDNLNDRFEFDILGATNIDISIFNRWGESVYENPNQKNGVGIGEGWDGTKDGKQLPYDTYVYQMRITYASGINPKGLTIDKAGTVTLMR